MHASVWWGTCALEWNLWYLTGYVDTGTAAARETRKRHDVVSHTALGQEHWAVGTLNSDKSKAKINKVPIRSESY